MDTDAELVVDNEVFYIEIVLGMNTRNCRDVKYYVSIPFVS